MALEPWRIGKVVKIEQQTYNTRRFFIQIPELTTFNYKPGQFVTLDLPIHEKPNKRLRSYSIASWPNGSNIFELCIVLLDGGAGTTYLFNEIKEGSEITLRGPVGVFTLEEEHLKKEVFLVCTGTGIAPFRSMIHYINENNIAHQNIHLIFGCRKFGDALYANELKELMRKEPGFFFHTCYSREEEENLEHLVRIGYVHQVFEEIINSRKGSGDNSSLPEASFFLCGWKAMIDEAKQRIQALGYDRKSIHQELYG